MNVNIPYNNELFNNVEKLSNNIEHNNISQNIPSTSKLAISYNNNELFNNDVEELSNNIEHNIEHNSQYDSI